MIDLLVLIKDYLVETYGKEGSLPKGFGSRRITKGDIKEINRILAKFTSYRIKVVDTMDVIMTGIISSYTRTMAVEQITSIGNELADYESDEVPFDTDGELYDDIYHGGTYEDYINKYSFELFKDTLVWLNAFLYSGTDPFNKVRDLVDKYYDKLTYMKDNTKNSILTAAVDKYNDKYTAFRYVANSLADEECLQYDGREFPIDKLDEIFPTHPNCRCSVILLTAEEV